MQLSSRLLKLTFIFVLYFLTRDSPVLATSRKDIYKNRLEEILSRNVSSLVPPLPETGKIPVEVSFQLHRIVTLISDSATLRVTGLIRVAWSDERYKWTSSPTYLLVPVDRLWIPDLRLSTSTDFSLRSSSVGSFEMVHLQSTGRFVLERTVEVNVKCNVDVQFFPKDIQLCTLSFMPAIAYQEMVVPVKQIPETPQEHGNFGEEWTLQAIKHKFEMKKSYHANGTQIFIPSYHLCLLLYRNHAFYFLTIIVPSLLLAIVVLLPHLIPPSQCNPKLLIPVTTFLSFNIYMLLLERSLPKASQVPVLGEAYAILLASCTLTELIQVVSINLYMCTHDRVPRPLSFLYFRILAPIACVRCRGGSVYVEEEEPENSDRPPKDKSGDVARIWNEMGRINDRFGLLITSILIIFAFAYLFVNLSAITQNVLDEDDARCTSNSTRSDSTF